MKVKKVSEENNNKLSVSEEKLFHISDPSMISSVPSSPSSTATMLSSAVSNLTEMLTDHICTHQRQCVLRQPKPPPADKWSILVHIRSKYHEHFLTSVPARYGPHDNCMVVEYENYGCSDCIWFKKWGQLHGYPDLWPLKYIKSGTYSDQILTDTWYFDIVFTRMICSYVLKNVIYKYLSLITGIPPSSGGGDKRIIEEKNINDNKKLLGLAETSWQLMQHS